MDVPARVSGKPGRMPSPWVCHMGDNYRETTNISHTLVGNKIVDHSDVVGASPVGAAPTTSSFSTQHMASMDSAKTTARRDEKHFSFAIWCGLYSRFDGNAIQHLDEGSCTIPGQGLSLCHR